MTNSNLEKLRKPIIRFLRAKRSIYKLETPTFGIKIHNKQRVIPARPLISTIGMKMQNKQRVIAARPTNRTNPPTNLPTNINLQRYDLKQLLIRFLCFLLVNHCFSIQLFAVQYDWINIDIKYEQESFWVEKEYRERLSEIKLTWHLEKKTGVDRIKIQDKFGEVLFLKTRLIPKTEIIKKREVLKGKYHDFVFIEDYIITKPSQKESEYSKNIFRREVQRIGYFDILMDRNNSTISEFVDNSLSLVIKPGGMITKEKSVPIPLKTLDLEKFRTYIERSRFIESRFDTRNKFYHYKYECFLNIPIIDPPYGAGLEADRAMFYFLFPQKIYPILPEKDGYEDLNIGWANFLSRILLDYSIEKEITSGNYNKVELNTLMYCKKHGIKTNLHTAILWSAIRSHNVAVIENYISILLKSNMHSKIFEPSFEFEKLYKPSLSEILKFLKERN